MPIGRSMLRLHRADGRDQFAHPLVDGVTHIDAEDVRAGLEQPAMTARSDEAGPSVATTLVRRCRLIGLVVPGSAMPGGRAAGVGGGADAGARWTSGLPGGGAWTDGCSAEFGQLHRPGALLAGIDLEKAGAVITVRQTIADAANRELLVAGAHKGLPHPFAAAIVVDGIDIIITRDEIALEHGLAGPGRQIPPAFRGPAVGVLVADGDSDPACGVVAEPEIGRRRRTREQAVSATTAMAATSSIPATALSAEWSCLISGSDSGVKTYVLSTRWRGSP